MAAGIAFGMPLAANRKILRRIQKKYTGISGTEEVFNILNAIPLSKCDDELPRQPRTRKKTDWSLFEIMYNSAAQTYRDVSLRSYFESL